MSCREVADNGIDRAALRVSESEAGSERQNRPSDAGLSNRRASPYYDVVLRSASRPIGTVRGETLIAGRDRAAGRVGRPRGGTLLDHAGPIAAYHRVLATACISGASRPLLACARATGRRAGASPCIGSGVVRRPGAARSRNAWCSHTPLSSSRSRSQPTAAARAPPPAGSTACDRIWTHAYGPHGASSAGVREGDQNWIIAFVQK
jgi:hypothetical protein